MTRLRFLVVSTIVAISAMIPWRRRYTVEEWCKKHGVVLEFHRGYSQADAKIYNYARLSLCDGSALGPARSTFEEHPDKFERDSKLQLLGTTQRFTRMIAPSPVECWDKAMTMAPQHVLMREVYFPPDLIV